MKKDIKKAKTPQEDAALNAKKRKYKITNWKEYNESLITRGSLNLWISDEAVEGWYGTAENVAWRPKKYSDQSIELILTLQQLYHLPLRAIQGFTRSLFDLVGMMLDVPNYTTLSRRNRGLAIKVRKSAKEITDIIIDSTGLKVYGEGEWKVRKHGAGKRRTWKKIHIAIDEKGEIRAVEVTENDTHDSEVISELLAQEVAPIEHFAGDGAYDTRSVYDALIDRSVNTIRIPPQKNAKIWQHGNSSKIPHPRDENLRAIRRTTRTRWKQDSGYHQRSLSENTMFRLKTIFGGSLRFRCNESQTNEVLMRANILNAFFALGMPQTSVVS
jgi:hypothetical protein